MNVLKKLTIPFLFVFVAWVTFACNPNTNKGEEPSASAPEYEEEMDLEETLEDESLVDAELEVEQPSIVEIASRHGSFNTLVRSLEAAGLTETLNGPGPYTVFAPTDEAFAALPEGTLEDLLKPENKDKLAAILNAHVVSGEVRSIDLTDGMTPESVSGEVLSVSTSDGVKVNEASVSSMDIQANNGVIHVVDKVIIPAEK